MRYWLDFSSTTRGYRTCGRTWMFGSRHLKSSSMRVLSDLPGVAPGRGRARCSAGSPGTAVGRPRGAAQCGQASAVPEGSRFGSRQRICAGRYGYGKARRSGQVGAGLLGAGPAGDPRLDKSVKSFNRSGYPAWPGHEQLEVGSIRISAPSLRRAMRGSCHSRYGLHSSGQPILAVGMGLWPTNRDENQSH